MRVLPFEKYTYGLATLDRFKVTLRSVSSHLKCSLKSISGLLKVCLSGLATPGPFKIMLRSVLGLFKISLRSISGLV